MLNCIIDDDLAEGADEVAEHAGLVHAPQHGLGGVREVRISMNSRLASGFSRSCVLISFERARHRAHRVGMEGEVVLLREPEDPDQIDRIVLEDVGRGEVDAVVVDDEIVAVGHPPRLRAGRNRATMRLSTGAGLACSSSSLAHRIAVRSPTSLATRK
jgi:hypothetical protein